MLFFRQNFKHQIEILAYVLNDPNLMLTIRLP
jgi:hypothetical protein